MWQWTRIRGVMISSISASGVMPASTSDANNGTLCFGLGGMFNILSMKSQISGIRTSRSWVELSRHGMNKCRSAGTSIRFRVFAHRASGPSLRDTMAVMLCSRRMGTRSPAS
jgi:hypothetical protein